ncbi:MAG: hypothetical protein JOZ80_02160 [Acidobacteriaceae bacterium]|nr:hypothetical protein [Acidobacteriaceae bacterium]
MPSSRNLDLMAGFESIPFHDSEKAHAHLAEIGTSSSKLAGTVLGLLPELPDPDCAIMLFGRFISQSSPETVKLLELDARLTHYLLLVFSHSQFLGETAVRHSKLLDGSLLGKDLDRSFSKEDFQEQLQPCGGVFSGCGTSAMLAAFKKCQYIRILLRDVLHAATLGETTGEISTLADVLLQAALEGAVAQLQGRYGAPQYRDEGGQPHDMPFAILALGKLGGNELNYSSDIDLMFLFGDGEEAPGCSLSHREYFIRLAQEVTSILSCATPEGPVFRIDLRLRPQGGEGELAISLAEALRYYATSAEDWELQALIKVRHSAGDATLARQFIRAVRPYVYKEAANFAAIKTALVAREKMQKQRRSHFAEQKTGIDVKIDSGGIRDIEFLVQCLQRVYGGTEPWLQSSGTLFALQKLHDNGHISGSEFHELSAAYGFLRTVEHRLQLRQGKQTHLMPISGPELEILQRAMSFFDPSQGPIDKFVEVLRQRMSRVFEIYRRVIYQQQTLESRDSGNASFQLRPTADFNIADHSNRHILERLAADAPDLYQLASGDDLSPAARKNLFRFFTAALTTSGRYGAVLRHRECVASALPIFDSSDYLTQLLTRHPEELASLRDSLNAPSRAGSGYLFETFLAETHRLDPIFAYVASSAASHTEKLRLLRRHFRHRVFAAGAKDILERRDVYSSCAEISSAAEDAIASAFEIAEAPKGLTIMALGRLGSGELDLLSDADLLFVCDDPKNRQYVTQAASHIVQILSAYTQDGMLFPVDTRLRPRGLEGELLTTSGDLARYFEREAHAWEGLTYTKLRYIAGSRECAQQVVKAAAGLYERFTADSGFAGSIREMRQKLEASDTDKNFKTSPGAIYDIDFLTGFLIVKGRIQHKNGNLRDRIWQCADTGLLDRRDAALLDHGGELLRTADHLTRLVVGRRHKWLPTGEHARHASEKLASDILGRSFDRGLETELERTCREIRQIYNRVLGVATG